jgi:putative PEP-CTERM system histidine kinase
MPPLPAWLAALPRARLLVPLVHQERLFGIVVLQQPSGDLRLNWEVLDLLKVAAGQVASYLALQAAAEALATARQFESYHRMSTFVVHDLKNLVAQLSLMIPNARAHGDNPAFRADMLETLEHAVQKTTLMLHKLLRSDARQCTEPVDLGQLLARLVALHGSAAPVPTLDCAVPVPGSQVQADPDRLLRVLGHLLQNAIDATPSTGTVRVRLDAGVDTWRVTIDDSGHGMSAQFMRERLFKPFETTKSAGMGIGAYESRAYILELGGTLEATSVPGCGATFTVTLPSLPPLPSAAPVRAPQPLGAVLG